MKRVVLAVVLLFGVIGFNMLCLHILGDIKNETTEKLDLLYKTVSEKGGENSVADCEDFTEYWLSKHHILCRIVRREPLEQITVAVARFSSLAKYGENGELSAEILRCKILMEEIYDEERPLLRNIF